MDFFKGILLLLVLVIIGSWLTQADFAVKNPGVAEFLGLTSSNTKTVKTKTATSSIAEAGRGNGGSEYQNIKIIGASISFENGYNQIVLRVGSNSKAINLSRYTLKTSMGAYSLPALNVGAGDYILLTSSVSPDGAIAHKLSTNHFEVYISQPFLSSGYETAELYNSAGVLVSKYIYGLSSLFQGKLGKEILLPS